MSLTFWIVIDPWYRKLCDTNIKSLFAPLLLSGASEKFCSCFFFFFFFAHMVCAFIMLCIDWHLYCYIVKFHKENFLISLIEN
jgi:hypothetical protein